MLWEIAQEPYCFSALFADGKCQHDRTIANAFGNLVSVELESIAFAIETAESNECLTLKGTKQFVGSAINESHSRRDLKYQVCAVPRFPANIARVVCSSSIGRIGETMT